MAAEATDVIKQFVAEWPYAGFSLYFFFFFFSFLSLPLLFFPVTELWLKRLNGRNSGQHQSPLKCVTKLCKIIDKRHGQCTQQTTRITFNY